MTRHVDVETLARYRDGDLHGWQAWRIRAHLASCGECREVIAELGQVTALLASVPEPPMPDDLSARIQGALAREAALRAASAPARPATVSERSRAASAFPSPGRPDGGPSRDLPRDRQHRPARHRLGTWWGSGSQVRLRAAAAAVALVVVVIGGYEIASHAGSSSSPSSSSAPQAGTANLAPRVSYGPPVEYERSGQTLSVTPMTTNTDFTARELNSQVSRLTGYQRPAVTVPSTVNPAANPAAGSSGSGPTFRQIPVSGMSGCLNRIAAGARVLLVDVDRFQGTPALVIVTQSSPASPKQIWVVSTSCSASASDILDHAMLSAGS